MCRNLMWAYKTYNPLDKAYKVKFIRAVQPDDDINKIKLSIRADIHRGEQTVPEPLQLPCGQCVECRLQRSRDWANRCILESKNYSDNYFLTLTYDPEHLPIAKKIDLATGEVLDEPTGTLIPKDLQDFIKRLRITWKRKYNHENIRFFACGEYGDKYSRPHYHVILFNCPIFDLKPDHKSKKGNMNYVSEEIANIWKKGRIAIGTVTWDSCAYTARYVLKKVTGKYSDEYYKIIGKSPEFVRMSRRPGIARDYFEEHKHDIYLTDEVFVPTSKGVNVCKPARYYDKLFDIDYHDELTEIKKARQDLAEMREELRRKLSDKDLCERYRDENETKDLKYKSLKRKFEKDGSI